MVRLRSLNTLTPMKKRSRFLLSAEIHLRYFLHSILLILICMLICKLIVGDEALLSGVFYGGIAGLFLFFACASGVMGHYTSNKSGSERIVRHTLRHRDIVTWDASHAFHWRAAKRVGRYAYVIPTYIWSITLTSGIAFIAQSDEDPLWLISIVLFLLGWILSSISTAYVNLHLCNPEINKMYRDPESYARALDYAKQEQQQREQDALIQAQLEKERARKEGLPPDTSQYKRPKKPY